MLARIYVYIIFFLSWYKSSLFDSVVAVAFQITFRVKMYANNVFFIFKKLFLISAHQNDMKILKIY
jgi:hypothetical protein